MYRFIRENISGSAVITSAEDMQFGDYRYSKLHKTTWKGKKPKEGFEVTPCWN